MLLAFLLAVVEGTVVNAITGAHIAGVKVEIRQAGCSAATAVSDASGGFRVEGLAEGEYSASFLASDFYYPRGAVDFRVGPGAALRLRVELTPLARLSGRVVDGERRPAAGVAVELIRIGNAAMNVTRTGQEGEFAFETVIPGTYWLAARPARREFGKLHRVKLERPESSDAARLDWAPTFYPAAGDRGAASRIVAPAGADLGGFEVRLRAVPVYEVRGVAFDETGNRAADVLIELSEPEGQGYTEYEAVSDAGGAFAIGGVREGEWRIFARPREADSKLRGFGEVMVAGGDVDRLEVRLAAPFTMSGHVNLAGAAVVLTAPDHSRRRAFAVHEPDGSFRFEEVYQGRYRIETVGTPRAAYLASILVGEREVLGQEVDLGPGSPPIRVIYGSNPGRVRGTVENGEDCTAAVVPREEALITEQYVRTAPCRAGGRFEAGGLRPGEYSVFAFENLNRESLYDAACRAWLAARAVKVEVREGEAAEVSLRLSPGCEVE
ncbi:MAG: carboxypeptidase regulatory-like domain-containing protein [Bryobacteraceae bacterium]